MSNIGKGSLELLGSPHDAQFGPKHGFMVKRCCSVDPKGGAGALGVATDYLIMNYIKVQVFPKPGCNADLGASVFVEVSIKEKGYTEWQHYTFDVTAKLEAGLKRDKKGCWYATTYSPLAGIDEIIKLNTFYNCEQPCMYEVCFKLYTVDDGTGLTSTIRNKYGTLIDGRGLYQDNLSHNLGISPTNPAWRAGPANPYYQEYEAEYLRPLPNILQYGPECHKFRKPVLTPESDATIKPLGGFMPGNTEAINNALGGGAITNETYGWGANYYDGTQYPLAVRGDGQLIAGAWCAQGWEGDCDAGCNDALGTPCPGGDEPADVPATGTGCGWCKYTWVDFGEPDGSGWYGDPAGYESDPCTYICGCGPTGAIGVNGTFFGQVTGLPCSGDVD